MIILLQALAVLELLDLVDQVEEVRLPRVVPRDRQNPFTFLSEEDFIERYRLSPACTLQLLDRVQPVMVALCSVRRNCFSHKIKMGLRRQS